MTRIVSSQAVAAARLRVKLDEQDEQDGLETDPRIVRLARARRLNPPETADAETPQPTGVPVASAPVAGDVGQREGSPEPTSAN